MFVFDMEWRNKFGTRWFSTIHSIFGGMLYGSFAKFLEFVIIQKP